MRKSTIMATAAVLLLGLLAPTAALADGPGPSGPFFDDDGNVHEGAIGAIRDEGVTLGCNPPQNTDYCPDSTVSRGAMAAFLSRALDLPATTVDFFSDDDGSVFESDINRMAAAGITKGCNPSEGNTKFCPDSNVTRGQMAAFLVRAFGYTDNGGGDLFNDDDDSIFEKDIDKLGAAGVTKGCNPPENTKFCPNQTVKRDQMASFLSRALGLPQQQPDLDHSVQMGLRFSLVEEAQIVNCAAAFDLISDGVRDVCKASTVIEDHWDFWVNHGWGYPDWSLATPQEKADATAWLTTVDFHLYLNGSRLMTSDQLGLNTEDDIMSKSFNFQFPHWLSGTHEITGEWIEDGFVEMRIETVVDLGE